MSNAPLSTSIALAVALLASPLFAQKPAAPAAPAKPLSEAELLKTIDSLGTGDPTGKAPLSSLDAEPSSPKKDDRKKEAPAKVTEITSTAASFDQKTHQAIFTGNVIVKNPDFTVTNCDKLTAFLRHDDAPADKAATGAKADPKGAPAPANGSAKPVVATPIPAASPRPVATDAKSGAKDAKDEKGGGGLERAIAECAAGKKVVIVQEKRDADGKVVRYVGKAEKVDYNATTGEAVLTGWPEVQQGTNSSVATDHGTVMILNREGRMKANGPTKVVITDTSDANGR